MKPRQGCGHLVHTCATHHSTLKNRLDHTAPSPQPPTAAKVHSLCALLSFQMGEGVRAARQHYAATPGPGQHWQVQHWGGCKEWARRFKGSKGGIQETLVWRREKASNWLDIRINEAKEQSRSMQACSHMPVTPGTGSMCFCPSPVKWGCLTAPIPAWHTVRL